MKKRVCLALLSAAALAAPIVATTSAHATAVQLPCDIINAAGQHCVAANSTTRALYAAYNGPLYTVKRASDNQTLVISTTGAGGVANIAPQDTFCAGTSCQITDIADQTPYNNDLAVETPYRGAYASVLPVTVDGQKTYGVHIEPGAVSYADYDTWMIPTGHQPITEYDVVGGTYWNENCCFDYGDTEGGSRDDGAGHMIAINYSGNFQADLENGVFGSSVPFNKPLMTGFVKSNGTSSLTIEQGDATAGGLTTSYNSGLPSGYKPLQLEGGTLLTTGGDGTNPNNTGEGDWYEGIIASGVTSAATDSALQAETITAY